MVEKVACQICQRVKVGTIYRHIPGIDVYFCDECWRCFEDYFMKMFTRGRKENDGYDAKNHSL